jgi:hypothetical protein
MTKQDTLPPLDHPTGAILNGLAHIDRLEGTGLECEAGTLSNCADWHELKRCFEFLAEWVDRAALAAQAPQPPAGFALVPLRMSQDMRDVTDSEGWTWEDLLAAAGAVTEEEYTAISAAPQQAQGVPQFLANGARYKVSWSDAGCYISGLPPELSGRWVAFVAADDNCHLAAAPQAEPQHTPHTVGGFRGWMVGLNGRTPTEQEIWDAAIRSYRDLAEPQPEREPLSKIGTLKIKVTGACTYVDLDWDESGRCILPEGEYPLFVGLVTKGGAKP